MNPRKKRRLHPRSKKDIYSVLQHHPSGIARINWTFSNRNFAKTSKHVNNKSKKLLSINVCCTNLRIFISIWKMPLYCIFSMHNFVFFFFFIFLEKAKLFFKMTNFLFKRAKFLFKRDKLSKSSLKAHKLSKIVSCWGTPLYWGYRDRPFGIARMDWTFSNHNFTKTLKHVNNLSTKSIMDCQLLCQKFVK